MTYTISQFMQEFPSDEACLEHLFKSRFSENPKCPKCGEKGKFRKLKKLPAYTCNCGHHIHPMAGTPFHRSSTSLQKWFYAMYLFTTSRHGVPAKELQRQLSVTYKTAWRMGHEIRKYMEKVDGDDPLSGDVEADETLIGGKRPGRRGRGASGKALVMGTLQRGGNVITKVIPDASRATLEGHIRTYVKPGSTILTDEWLGYSRLKASGYGHEAANHAAKEWVRGKAHTNSLEGLWSILKRSIRGTHVHVSAKYLPSYLGEFEFRFNLRKQPHLMFPLLLSKF